MTRAGGKLLLIGWDGADWKIIHKLVDEGKMPYLKAFIEDGVIGNLATLYPTLSPMLWTSIATGKRPHKHGILGFTEPEPNGGGIRPVSSLSRKTRALWNMATLRGLRSIVVGWWPSHPVEPIHGVMVSNHFQRANQPYGKPWPVRKGCVHPERIVEALASLRVHPQELPAELMSLFIPRMAELDQEQNHRLESVARITADCATVAKVSSVLLTHEPWDLAAIYFDSIDHYCHGFMNFHPPRLPWIGEKIFEMNCGVVEAGYRYHDALLGSLLKSAGEGVTTLIISDHGFHSDHLRLRYLPKEPAGPARQHRHYGILAARGPGIKRDQRIYGASLLDICPTVLSVL
ncbi:MAG: alkaline phosphatase family protein, partial [Planctomycetes bacterium]|nr:alkaline phosphatase family protein [Planctomycetota bacterium]